jgi:ABC-type molybdate transport system permease subunit
MKKRIVSAVLAAAVMAIPFLFRTLKSGKGFFDY